MSASSWSLIYDKDCIKVGNVAVIVGLLCKKSKNCSANYRPILEPVSACPLNSLATRWATRPSW